MYNQSLKGIKWIKYQNIFKAYAVIFQRIKIFSREIYKIY